MAWPSSHGARLQCSPPPPSNPWQRSLSMFVCLPRQLPPRSASLSCLGRADCQVAGCAHCCVEPVSLSHSRVEMTDLFP